MFHNRFLKFASIMLVVLVALCATVVPALPASAQGTEPPTPEPSILQSLGVDRIEIEIDANGEPSFLGMPASWFGLNIAMDPSYVTWMMSSNIQHVEMRQSGADIALYANGQLLGLVSWDSKQMAIIPDIAKVVSPGSEKILTIIVKILPIIEKLGVNVAVKFPVAVGAVVIDLSDLSKALPEIQPTTDSPKLTVEAEVDYDINGVPSMLGISAADLTAMGMYVPVALDIRVVQSLQSRNIQHIELRTGPDGIQVYTNNNIALAVRYDRNTLMTVAGLYEQLGLVGPPAGMVKNVSTNIDRISIGLLMNFAPPAGVESIEATLHKYVPPNLTATATPAAVTTPTPATVLLVDVTCPDGQVHRGLTPAQAATACPTPAAPKGAVGGQNGGGGPW